jgi:hypothetical protein
VEEEFLFEMASLLAEIGYPTNPGMGEWCEKRDDCLRRFYLWREEKGGLAADQ